MADGRIARRLAAMVVAGLMCGVVLGEASHAQEQNDLARLLGEVSRLHSQGKYADAIPIAERYVALARERHGEEHTEFATALVWLGLVYRALGRYAEAEPLFRRSLAIREKALGPEHRDVAATLNDLAGVHQAEGRYAEAERLFTRSLAIREKALGPEHPDVATTLNNLALLHRAQGRNTEAEPLYRRSLTISEKVLGPEHPDVATTLNNLALLQSALRRDAEAERLLRRSLAIREKALAPDHPSLATSLNNLAHLLRTRASYAEAEPLYRRSLTVLETTLGPEHPTVAASLNNLAALYMDQGRQAEAEPLYRRSLAIREKALGLEHPSVAATLSNLALLHQDQGRYAEAESSLRRSLAIREKMRGPEHPDVAISLTNLAQLHQGQGRHAEAGRLYQRSLAILEKALGPEHPSVAGLLNNLARLAFDQTDWAQAADYWRRSTGVIQRRAERGLAGAAEGSAKGEAQRFASQFAGLVKTTHRLAMRGRVGLEAEGRAMFETAQWAQGSEAAASLAQMAARSAMGSPELGVLVRERQDLGSEWQAKDKQLIAAKSEEPAKRKAAAEKALSDRLAAIDMRLTEINAQLAKDFPDYTALASPTSVSVTEVQAQLGDDEALVLFLDTPDMKPLPEETFVWVVTKTDSRWVRTDLGTKALTEHVAALRCGLDQDRWGSGLPGDDPCFDMLGKAAADVMIDGRNVRVLPFDHARAHRLYMALFGEVQDLIEGKHLLIVPSGPLTQLPFQVLVTRPPTSGDHRAAAWLAREHAVTVLPAVSSLKALRRVGRPSAAPRPMIGFGNPLLDGRSADYPDAKLAREKQRCPDASQQVAAGLGPRGGAPRIETRGGLADIATIRRVEPLPDTADELCAVARDVNADLVRDIRLGKQATEREIKGLSASGELAKYRMLHFATHGVLAGKLDGTHEPGLILTPPDNATEEDDGYLSASEIAGLKLDADWVILSACNTAAGGTTSAEALSGLGRAFIYAGARALLVSHWAVYSDATVKLVTGASREMAGDPKVGRAEALRRSMLKLIDRGALKEAHPAYWAPFIVVGEGGLGR